LAAPSFLAAILRAPQGEYGLVNIRTGEVLAAQIEPAFDSRSRRRGLLGRDKLDAGTALIIAPCNGIHTFFMRFAIDVVFAARDGRVLKTYSALPPWRIGFAVGAFAAIELPAGTLSRCDATRGDRLRLTSP
jgi:uncharacterized membrane protein (UPF0127 family)